MSLIMRGSGVVFGEFEMPRDLGGMLGPIQFLVEHADDPLSVTANGKFLFAGPGFKSAKLVNAVIQSYNPEGNHVVFNLDNAGVMIDTPLDDTLVDGDGSTTFIIENGGDDIILAGKGNDTLVLDGVQSSDVEITQEGPEGYRITNSETGDVVETVGVVALVLEDVILHA